MKQSSIPADDDEVVHISAISTVRTYRRYHHLVEIGQQQIGKQLARKVSDRKAFILATCEQRLIFGQYIE